MYQQYRPNSFNLLSPVVKNLLIINGLFFLATIVLQQQGTDLTAILGLHYPLSPEFRPHQFVTYLFMHGDFMHLLFNMLALYMFGNSLENYWGSKRFLIYYIVTGVGAALIQLLVTYINISSLVQEIPAEGLNLIATEGLNYLKQNQNFVNESMRELNLLIHTPIVGASGALFGILLAFGMLFPNTLLYVYFAIPIKAKWFVFIYGCIELASGIANRPDDNVAHFAHLGGMLFGFILIKIWNRNRTHFY
jgi:membrane associated rhomboid family serine protease